MNDAIQRDSRTVRERSTAKTKPVRVSTKIIRAKAVGKKKYPWRSQQRLVFCRSIQTRVQTAGFGYPFTGDTYVDRRFLKFFLDSARHNVIRNVSERRSR